MKNPLILAALLAAMPSAFAQSDATVVAIGASNTSGFGVGEAAAYPARLEGILRACGYAARVVNAGISFETTNGMLARIDRDVPDGTRVVVIQPGGNDRRFFVSKAQRAANIEHMKARLGERGIAAVVYDPVFPPEAYQWDGIHLTAARHILVAKELAPAVAAHLGKPAPGPRDAGCSAG